jgi:hypothetical protein
VVARRLVVAELTPPTVIRARRSSTPDGDRRYIRRWLDRNARGLALRAAVDELRCMWPEEDGESFNAVNTLRILGRWMRMFTIPNQSSVAMAYKEFDDIDDARRSSMVSCDRRQRTARDPA